VVIVQVPTLLKSSSLLYRPFRWPGQKDAGLRKINPMSKIDLWATMNLMAEHWLLA
jgi:hypothetical protein